MTVKLKIGSSNPPNRSPRVNRPQGFRTFVQVDDIEFVFPDIDKAELVPGLVVVWTFEQRSLNVDVWLWRNELVFMVFALFYFAYLSDGPFLDSGHGACSVLLMC